MQTVKQHAVHGGTLRYLKHDSAVTGTPMTLSVFVPGGEGPFPVLIWLSAWMKTILPLPQAISVLGFLFLLGLVVLIFLPETKGKDLPE